MSGTQADLTEGVPCPPFMNVRIIPGKADGWNQPRPLTGYFSLFRSYVERDLRLILNMPVGFSLLNKINEAGKMGGPRCFIALGKATVGDDVDDAPPTSSTVYRPSMRPGAGENLTADLAMQQQEYGTRLKRGPGAPAIVCYNPFFDYTRAYAGMLGIPMPSFVVLAHELIHASHTVRGKVLQKPESAPPAYDMNGLRMITNEQEKIVEEARTIGAGKYASRKVTENAIRREHRLAERLYYETPGDCDAANLPAWSPDQTRPGDGEEY